MMRARSKALVAIALNMALAWALAGPGAALAQDAPIPTAAGAPNGGAPDAGDGAGGYGSPLRLDDHPDDGPGFLRPAGPCGGPAKTADGKTDKSPHGEVWAGVGTHGYREGGGVVCVPVGDQGSVTIAVDAGQINGRRH
jgi:hypothetical protein